MGIKKKLSKMVDHVYCAMCGQMISFNEVEMGREKQSKVKIQCPGCGHEINADIGINEHRETK